MNSLYVHIPFCRKKCFYCSFAVAVSREGSVDFYIDKLNKEAELYQGTTVKTIYIGGGSPSFLSVEQLGHLFSLIRKRFLFDKDIEITLEANPEDVREEKAAAFLEQGVTRVSLGVQSFNDRYLALLGRCYDSRRARQAFDLLRRAGVENINLDLMYSFPEQSFREITEDARAVAGLAPEHISLYSLTVEPNSLFFARGIKAAEQGRQAAQYFWVLRALRSTPYCQYEISNFSLPGKESRHNLNYWQSGDYIGLGVSAHSHQQGTRSWNVLRVSDYLKRLAIGNNALEGHEELTARQKFSEQLLFGLRMNRGVSLRDIARRSSWEMTEEQILKLEEFISQQLLERKGDRVMVTAKGRLVLDELSAQLV